MGLMIDTMCNGVGGLVLVAILIVLVSIGESPSSAEGQMRRKQLENEVEALKIREELLRSENQRMFENKDVLGDKLVKSISVGELERQSALILSNQKKILNLEKRLEQLQQQQAQALVTDPGAYVATELEAHNRLSTEVSGLEGQLREVQKDLALKETKYSELLTEVAAIKENRSRTLKVPVERRFSRYDFIFFRYGKCYTMTSESAFSPGSSFQVLFRDEYSINFEPRSDAGVAIDSAEIHEFLKLVKRRGGTCSLGFYPDSFHLFLPVQQLLDDYGLSLGVDFYTTKNPPGFTTVGGVDIMGQGQ